MPYQRVFFTLSALLFLSACGTGGPEGTPLAHHPKEQSSQQIDTSALSWGADNGEGLKISVDEGYLYMQFDYSSEQSDAKNVQFIIEIDDNTSTGNRTEENGADYIVENGYLYRSKSADIWDWEELGKVEMATGNRVDTVRIDLNKLHNRAACISVNAELLGDDWKPVYYSPSGTDSEGNHKKTRYCPASS